MKHAMWLLTAFALTLAGAGVTHAQQAASQIDPDAMNALHRMGTYLRTLKAFQVEAVTTNEEVMQDGQKVQYTGEASLVARTPDRLRVSVRNDRRDRLYVYDGKQFTMLARRPNYYATVPAPPTIGELADAIDEKHGVQLPLEDLFQWGGPRSTDAAITSAMFVGRSEMGGVSCGHYAFRQEGLDWQVWIQLGDFPLPRRLVLTTMTDEARPQYTATYTWNLAPSFNDATFTFVPPPGANKVVLAEID